MIYIKNMNSQNNSPQQQQEHFKQDLTKITKLGEPYFTTAAC